MSHPSVMVSMACSSHIYLTLTLCRAISSELRWSGEQTEACSMALTDPPVSWGRQLTSLGRADMVKDTSYSTVMCQVEE